MKTKVDLSRVEQLYSKIVNIEQYFRPVEKWTSILPDGTDVRSRDLYYETIANATSSHEIEPDIRERIIQMCIDAGATIIQLKCTDDSREYCYPDYMVSELVK